MAEKITVARLKKFGETFEIHVDPDAALRFKKGELSNLRDVLMADHIFTDAKKGQLASHEQLQKAFKTIDTDSIATKILKDGEIQATSEHRSQEREQKLKKLVYLISRQAVDPKTGLPHPPMRIELAIAQAKVHLDDHKTAEEQFDEVLVKLRPILPIKIEQKKVMITIPSQYAGKMYGVVSSLAKILKEEWKNDGSWQATVEMPAGMYPEFIDKLNSLTHGQVTIT